MRGPCMLIGATAMLDGFFTAVFSKRYVSRFWGSFNFSPQYNDLIQAYSSLSDRTLRIFGVTEFILGALTVAPGMEKKEFAEVEEEISKERFSQILRELAESLDKSRSFQTEIKGYQVTIPEQANVKIEYEQKENGGELELEVKWEGAA